MADQRIESSVRAHAPTGLLAALCCAAICLVATSTPRLASAACPEPERVEALVNQSKRLYLSQAYDDLADTLEPLVEPEECPTARGELLEIYLMLGTAFEQLEDGAAAERYFLRLLRLDPEFDFDEFELPRSTREFASSVREAYSDELDDGEGGEAQTYYVAVEYQHNQLWVNFVPFGAGQFQNGETGWGIAYLSVEVAALLLSITGAIAVEVVRGDTFTFSAPEAQLASEWQTVQLASAGVFLGIYAVGVVHGLVNYEERVLKVYRPPTRTPPEAPTDGEVSLAPMLLPDGGGMVMGVQF